MEFKRGINIALKGERFVQKIRGFDFNSTSEIKIVLFDSYGGTIAKTWTKTAGDVLVDNDTFEVYFCCDTAELNEGLYSIEIKVDFLAVECSPIAKNSKEYLKIKPSKTENDE